jgi:hypothetical protein
MTQTTITITRREMTITMMTVTRREMTIINYLGSQQAWLLSEDQTQLAQSCAQKLAALTMNSRSTTQHQKIIFTSISTNRAIKQRKLRLCMHFSS